MRRKNRSFGKGDWRAYFRLIPYIRLPWVLIAIGFVVDLTYSDVMAKVPVSTSALFSGEFTGAAFFEAVLYNVMNFGLMFASMILTSVVSSIAVRRAQEILWGRMLQVDMAFYDSHDPADLMSTLTSDTDTAVKSLVSQLISMLPSIYYLFAVCRTLGSYDYRLLISILILVPVNVIYVVILGRWQYEVNAGIYGKIGSLTAYLAERVSNIYLIRSFTNEAQEEKNGLEASAGLYKARVRAAKVSCAASLASTVMEILQRGLPIVFGMLLLRSGAINMQQWVAFFLFTGQVITRVNGVVSVWSGIKSAQGCAARMVTILEAPAEPELSGTASGETVADGDICFQDVSFAYGDKEVLHNVSFTVPQGKTTALVGRCGSGKTTILSLLERLYTPSSGTITLAGNDVSQADLAAYRNHFGYVQQDAGIFGGTYRSAITYGVPNQASDAEILAAAEKTGISSLIQAAPDGLDTKLAVSGGSVSGGQRQRMVLARELLKKRPVLLLDEPTSALDAMTALSIQKELVALFPNATRLMITHDLRMLSQVDQVIFLENGRVLDCGTPAELMERCEPYRTLVCCGEEAAA